MHDVLVIHHCRMEGDVNHVWSYSSLDTFNTCPRKFYHRYILKEKEPSSPALEHGNAVHAALEARVKGTPLPECYRKYDPMAQSVINAWKRGMKVYTELKMGLAKEMELCGFFDKNVWGRGAADVLLVMDDVAIIMDWKTGKKREKEEQLRILALFTFKHFPRVNYIKAANLWLEVGDVGTPYTWTREDEPQQWAVVLPQIQAIEKAFESDKWPEKPSGLCGWCSVKACQFNKS